MSHNQSCYPILARIAETFENYCNSLWWKQTIHIITCCELITHEGMVLLHQYKVVFLFVCQLGIWESPYLPNIWLVGRTSDLMHLIQLLLSDTRECQQRSFFASGLHFWPINVLQPLMHLTAVQNVDHSCNGFSSFLAVKHARRTVWRS